MISFIVFLCDQFLFCNRFIEALLEAYVLKKENGLSSIELRKIAIENQCRSDLLKIMTGEVMPFIAKGG